jgi:hypothetical protein
MAIYIQSRKVHKEQLMGDKEFSNGQTPDLNPSNNVEGEGDFSTNIGGYTDNLYRRGRGIMKITF